MDRKPGIVLRALKTAEETTRSPAFVWWPMDGLVAHAAYGAHIPSLGRDYKLLSHGGMVLSLHQLIRMWRVIKTTELEAITSDNLARSMGSKNGAEDVFFLRFVVTFPFPEASGDSGVSFRVCIAEFIHVRHTDEGDLKKCSYKLLEDPCCLCGSFLSIAWIYTIPYGIAYIYHYIPLVYIYHYKSIAWIYTIPYRK
jgi:hypothetical protein